MKWITERQFDKLFDSCEDGSFSPENYAKLLERQHELDDYHVIGFRTFLESIKTRINDYKLFHPKLGKVVFDSDKKSFHIEKMSWGIHWQTDRFLSVIIRDYLRSFISQTPAIGNCVLKEDQDDNDSPGGWSAKALMCNPNTLEFEMGNDPVKDDAFKRWVNMVNMVAEDFDEVRKILESEEYTAPETELLLKAAVENACDGLKHIYMDLNW